jgi:hypothetical protein
MKFLNAEPWLDKLPYQAIFVTKKKWFSFSIIYVKSTYGHVLNYSYNLFQTISQVLMSVDKLK